MISIQVNQAILAKTLARVIQTIPKRATVTIIESFKLTASPDGTLEVTGTNLDEFITSRINCIVLATGDAMVNAKELLAAVKTLNKNALVHLRTDSSTELTIFCDGITQRLQTTGAADDFPNAPKCDDMVATLSADQIKSLQDMTFAAQNYGSNSILEAVHLNINGKLEACSTDGSRLIALESELKAAIEIKANVRATVIDYFGKCFEKTSNIVVNAKRSMSGDKVEHLQFTDGGNGKHHTTIITRMIAGEYPRYTELFPDNYSAKLYYDRLPLLAAVKAGAKLNPKTHLVKLDGVTIRATDVDKEFSATIPHNASDDIPVIAMNGNYLADWLEVTGAQFVEIEVTGSLKPVERTDYKGKKVTEIPATLKPLIMHDTDRGLRYLLMPVQSK